ncbi:hypothetical protein BS78_03G189000 [Paspalum vaginatum]|nr:hypothetical protein BS78_03G189000 [Paspalum vaginatum]
MPPPLQITMFLVAMSVSPAAVLGIATDKDCKCFMCVCDLDPHPLPPEMPTHHPTPSPPPPEPVPSPPPPAPELPAYYPPPTTGYYYPPQPYGYPWYPATYGPPAEEMYPREDRRSSKSGAAARHHGDGGHGRARLFLAVALASAVLSLLVHSA